MARQDIEKGLLYDASEVTLRKSNTHNTTSVDFTGSDELSRKKSEYGADEVEHGHVQDAQVKRELKARHVSMIALGGTIGSGLLINLSSPLSMAGPVNSLIAYLFIGSIVYSITQSLGEMATFIPVTSSFTVFNGRFLSRPIGVSQGIMYWYNWAVTFAVEISVIGQVIQYWTDAVPLAAWISIFWVTITAVNFFPVKFYGEIEFWVASIKVITIVGFIFYALIIVCGGSPEGPIGFRYWRNPGAWGPGYIYEGTSKGRFLGWVSSLINASFTYQGSETFALAVGETKNPRKTVPKAINKVFFRILLFYIGSLFFVGLLVPYNDDRLSSSTSYIASSPFIIAIENAGTPILPHIFNAVILTTLISAANSNIYVGSRILYGLASNNNAPKIFKKVTKQGVPYWGVLATSTFGALAYMVTADSAAEGFNWLVNISTVAGLIAWFFISVCHIRFMQCLKSRGISRDDLPFKAKFMPYGAYYSAFFVFIIIFVQGYEVFIDFNVSDFFVNYVSLILDAVIFIACQIYYRGPFLLPLDEIDIDSDRREIDEIVWEDDEPKNLWEKVWAFLA